MFKINKINLSLISIVIFFISSSPIMISATRPVPKKVTPVIYEGVEYRATHEKMGYVEAWDLKTGKKLWEKKIYKVGIYPPMEEDVQWVFITELKIKGGKLIISNEKGDRYSFDLKTNSGQAVGQIVPAGQVARFIEAVKSGDFHQMRWDGEKTFREGFYLPEHLTLFKGFPSSESQPGQVRYTFFSFHGEASAGEISLFVEKDTGKIIKFDAPEASF